MNSVYPSIVSEYFDGTQWVDVSSYVVSDFNGEDGFTTSEPDDRVAGLGYISFDMNNVNGYFSPMGGDALRGLSTLTGWREGAKFRIRVVYENINKSVFTGRLGKIKTDDGTWGNQRVHVTAWDWMDVATRFPMKGAEVEVNQTVDQSVQTALNRMSIQPEGTDLHAGDETLPTTFDNVNKHTRAVGEFDKLMKAELGYLFVTKDGILTVENSSDRKGTRKLDNVPVAKSLSGILLLPNGGALLLPNGGCLILNQVETSPIMNSMESLEIEDDGRVIDSVSVRAYPRKVDSSTQTLFTLNQPIPIAGGQTLPFRATYANPNGGSPINADPSSMIPPVATTDYQMWTGVSGTGSDLTAYLSVSAVYFGDVIDYTLTSTYTGLGYITRLNARGKGIYRDNPIEYSNENVDAMDLEGESLLELDQKYKADLASGAVFADSILEEFGTSKSRVKSASFLANLNSSQMMAFLYLDKGSLIRLYENRSRIYNYYYIVHRKYTISVSGIIHYTFMVQQADSLLSGGLQQVTTRLGAPNAYVDYGVLPKIANAQKISVSIWATPYVVNGALFHKLGTDNGWQFALGGTNQLQWYQKQGIGLGEWHTATGTIVADTRYHLVATRDTSSDYTAAPKIYINKVQQSLLQDGVPIAPLNDDTGLPLKIGNGGTSKGIFDHDDPRIYIDKILTQAEIDELYAAGPTGGRLLVTDNLEFQGSCLFTDNVTGAMATGTFHPSGSYHMLDNIHKYVGVVTETSRSWMERSQSNTYSYFSIAWSPSLGMFAAVGGSTISTIITSPDGITWTSRLNNTSQLYAVCWSEGLGMFVAVGNNSVRTSTDGITWTARTPAAANDWRCVAWSPELGLFVAGAVSGTAANRIMSSTDGIHWSSVSAFGIADWEDIAWSPELHLFVLVSSDNILASSSEGSTWTQRTNPGGECYGVDWSPELGMFVAVGYNNIITSTNGISWSTQSVPEVESWRDVVWSRDLGIFMAVGENATHRSMKSTNGTSWSVVNTPNAASGNGWYGICWSPEMRIFVAVAYTGSTNNHVMIY